MPEITAAMIRDLVDGTYEGDPDTKVMRVAPIETATRKDLSFIADEKRANGARASEAALILVPEGIEERESHWIEVEHPAYAISKVLEEWFWERPSLDGIADSALIHESARIDSSAGVGAFVQIGPDVEIGEDVVIMERCSIGARSRIDAGTILYPGVTLYSDVTVGRRCTLHSGVVLGADGFGFATWKGAHHKVPQLGGVRIGDDVEIGANSTVDRGTLGDTIIGDGTRIDNLVMIAHNVEIGKHCLLAAQTGIAGSTTVGDYSVFAGQSGAVGHLKIGSRVQVAGQSALTKNTEGPITVSGKPARPLREQLRKEALLARLPQLVERVKRLEKELKNDD